MRHIPAFLMGILVLAPMRLQAGTDTKDVPQWKLIGSDEFNAPGTTAPDPAKWRYRIDYVRVYQRATAPAEPATMPTAKWRSSAADD